MQILDPKEATTQSPDPTGPKLLTRPGPGWINVPNLLWLVGTLAAIGAIGYLLAARPVLIRSWNADNFTTAVKEKNDYRIYQPETDAGGQRFAWTQPQKALFIVPASSHNGQPVKVTVRARGASAANGPVNSTTVTANGVAIGQISPLPNSPEFQDFTFNITPAYRDDHRIYLYFDTPAWKPPGDKRELGFALQSVSVDLQEVWSPVVRPGRAWVVWLLPLLAGLLLLAGLTRIVSGRTNRQDRIFRQAGYVGVGLSLGMAAVATLWAGLLSRVGWNGELNHSGYWLAVVGAVYLGGFGLWLALAGWGWGKPGQPSLLEAARQRTRSWREQHPYLTAYAAIFGFNLALSVVFVGKVVLETGSIAQTFRYLDGPEYIFIANGFYDLNDPLLGLDDFNKQSRFYWAAHFPGFAVLLLPVKAVVGWLWAPLVANFVASTAFAAVFYRLVRDFNYARHPLWLALVALVLPVRWLIYHNVGSSEPLFMFLAVLSLYFFKKEGYWRAGLAGAAALFTRPPGLFLWGGFMLLLVFEAAVKTWNEGGWSLSKLLANLNWRAFVALLLIPLGLVAVFGIYAWRYGDFLAYFKITENVTHLDLIPFPTLLDGKFNAPALIYLYLLEGAGLVMLWRQRRYDIFLVGLASFFYTLFLMHSDVLRYSIPFFALIVLIPFADYASGKIARWLAAPALLGLFFYSWAVFDDNLAVVETFEQMKAILHITMR